MANAYIVIKETNYKQKLRVFAGSEEEARLKIVNGEGFPVNVNDQPEVINVNMSNWPTVKDTVFGIDHSHSIKLFISGNVQNCPYCSAAQAFFKSFGLQIEVIDIATNLEEKERIIRESGNDRIPKVEIDGKLETGFNPNATTEILLKAGILNTKQSMTKENNVNEKSTTE
jgi:glutaredoxin